MWKVYFKVEGAIVEHHYCGGSKSNAEICKIYEEPGDKEEDNEFDLVDNLNHYWTISSRFLFGKKKDSKALRIFCTIMSLIFSGALCDLGTSINLMLPVIYK